MDVQSDANGFACPSATNKQQRAPVTFGENMKGGCTLWLPYSSLDSSTACSTLRAQIVALQTLTAQNINLVGIWGNASVNNALSDWVTVIDSKPAWLTTLVGEPANL
jgi:hypothetical protein